MASSNQKCAEAVAKHQTTLLQLADLRETAATLLVEKTRLESLSSENLALREQVDALNNEAQTLRKENAELHSLRRQLQHRDTVLQSIVNSPSYKIGRLFAKCAEKFPKKEKLRAVASLLFKKIH